VANIRSRSQDNDTITVEYKPFGVELNFTPVVVDGDIINLTINAAVSSIDPSTLQADGFTINAFKRRETSTTVEMRDGESFAIAGLLQDDFRDLNARFRGWATCRSSAPCSAAPNISARSRNW
jgi:pilus assembly protein CpaC